MDQVQRIHELLDEVQQKFDALVGTVNNVLSHVPFLLRWAADKFLDWWNGSVVPRWHDFWAEVGQFLSYLGAPWVLESRQDAWADVGAPVAVRATESDRSASDVDFEWTGQAADRYSLSLGAQRSALAGVLDNLTSRIGPALGSVASALYIFYAAVVAAVIAVVAGIVAATGEAVTVLGLPLVPPTVLTALGVAIVAIGAAVTNLRGQASGAASTFADIANETSSFGPGDWPAAVI